MGQLSIAQGDLTFTDVDTNEYTLEGLIQWNPPPDEHVVQSYDVWIVPDQVRFVHVCFLEQINVSHQCEIRLYIQNH